MVEHTAESWSVGRTLRTQQTQAWTKEQWDDNERQERRRVFARFTDADQGRSRILVAECRNADDAALVAAAPDMLTALEKLIAEADDALPNPMGWAAESLAESIKSLAQPVIDMAKPKP